MCHIYIIPTGTDYFNETLNWKYILSAIWIRTSYKQYLNELASAGAGESRLRKAWILLNQFFKKTNPRNNPMVNSPINMVDACFETQREIR